MNGGHVQRDSVRYTAHDMRRLLWAFLISAAVHFGACEGYQVGKRYHLFQSWAVTELLNTVHRVFSAVLGEPMSEVDRAQTEPEMRLVFIEVPPAVETTHPPARPRYYSDRNALAGNPEPDSKSDRPKIDGTQMEIPRLMDVKEPGLTLQTSRQSQEVGAGTVQVHTSVPMPASTPEPAPAPIPTTGLLARVESTPTPGPDSASRAIQGQKQDRPRSLAEALARVQGQAAAGTLVGEKMKQEGGVRRHSLVSSEDVAATPFGDYDRMLIEAVQARWYYLLDSGQFSAERKGRVVIEFILHHDGRVSDVRVVENTVNDLLCLLCEKAIVDPAPYGKWKPEMRRLVGRDYRQLRFTFYYN